MYEDTYFLNAEEALRVASLQNKTNNGYVLQVCYYSGEKIKSEYQNLIHLPIENLVNDLAKGEYRIPTKVDFTGLDISASVRLEILQNFNISLEQARDYRNQYNAFYSNALKNAKLDFSEPLRFYLLAASGTRVMQHISKNIANSLQSLGHEVLFVLDIGINDMKSLKKMAEFNPHATININHINNAMLGEDVFNFIWIQDYFAIEQFKHIALRKRDKVFHLVKSLAEHLQNINIISQYQGFCIDGSVYKHRDSIERKNKIVLIGGSYKINFDIVKNKNKNKIAESLMSNYISPTHKTESEIAKYYKHLRDFFNITSDELGEIVKYVQRDRFLLYIANLDIAYEIEIYGWGWEQYDEIKDNYKGILAYGEDISKVYNSAKYTLVLGGYALQQRTLESAASGCIPLIYDSRNYNKGDENETCFKESLVFFTKPDEITSLVETKHNLDLNCIVKANSYTSFAEKMLNIINENTLG
ncbi:MAG: hypothetical protein L3I99_00715 [Sulfurimonas sp.]|nr:hypothetical protein [Sulfurimonas sp.]